MNMKIVPILTLLLLLQVAFAGITGPSPIPPAPGFQISSSAASLCRDRVNYVPVTVTNKGALGLPQMQSVVLNLVGVRGLTSVGNGTINAGTINSSSSKTFYMPLLVGANASSFISTGISINYNFFTFYSDSEVRNLSFSIYTCPSPLTVAITPNIITQGGTQTMKINLTNVGNTTISNIALSFAVQGQSMTLLGGQPSLITEIPPRSSHVINESVYLSRNASQLFPFNVTGTFYNGSQLNLVSAGTYLEFGGVINLTTASLAISPQSPTPGSIFSVSFILTNQGTTKASGVTATILPGKSFTPFGTNPTFVGDIAVDSQTPVTLSVTASNNLKSGSYVVPIRINYLDNLRDNISMKMNVTVKLAAGSFNVSQIVRTRQANGGLSDLLIAVLVLVIIALAVLYLMERRRRRVK